MLVDVEFGSTLKLDLTENIIILLNSFSLTIFSLYWSVIQIVLWDTVTRPSSITLSSSRRKYRGNDTVRSKSETSIASDTKFSSWTAQESKQIMKLGQPEAYIGQVQSFGPKSPVGAPTDRPGTPMSLAPRPLPWPPAPAPPPDGPEGRALAQRLHTPRNAKFTLEQLLEQ
jgi:hypothetical protein